ncbi:MAG: tRNA (adenosine(37)-N6)-threonylcarbamoyltransferase complex dimerization subunit type 1 TsaB [Akkermansiaceae bacterium]
MRSVLIFETSTNRASLALAVDGEVVVEKSFTSDRRHNALIFEPLSEIIEEYGRRSFDAVFVGTGPGSYSGTRVGIAAAQGAALVAGCKAVGIPSILGTEGALSGDPCLAVGDARRGSFWTACIDKNQLTQQPLLMDRIGFDQALKLAEEKGTKVFSFEAIRDTDIRQCHPTASGLWEAWQQTPVQVRANWASSVPQPIYLAPPHITPSKKEVFGKIARST